MRLKYLILAHACLGQVDRLIKALSHEKAEFFIHLDRKVSRTEIQKYNFPNLLNVTIIEPRLEINWGGFNMVRATMYLIAEALKDKADGYLVLLSGQDFPIKHPDIIYNRLSKHFGIQYLDFFSLPSNKWTLNNGTDRLQYYWFIDSLGYDESVKAYLLQQSGKRIRPYLKNIMPFGGSQWWCITSECAAYIMQFLKQNAFFEDYYRNCFVPDEMFFQTIILNSNFSPYVVNDNLRYIDWDKGPQYPRVLTSDDLTSIISSDSLWARKFIDFQQCGILSKLERQLFSY